MSQRTKRAPSLTPEQKLTRRLRARLRFKALVRLVIANLYWMTELGEMRIGDNVMKNIHLITRKKVKRSDLTIQEKTILSKPKEERTDEEKQILSKAIGGLKCFRRYPPEVKSQLAAVTYFVYYGPGRQIVKQDHVPQAMYFIMSGEVSVTVRHFDPVLNEDVLEDSGTMSVGTMFGEVALIHSSERLATITTLTPCELLMIKKEDFDLVLKDTVQKAWDEIQKIMNEFTYFKNWDKFTRRECAIISRTKMFAPDETVLGDNSGLASYVFFLTRGTCSIIEHLQVTSTVINGRKKYKFYQPKKESVYVAEEVTFMSIMKKYKHDTITSNTKTSIPVVMQQEMQEWPSSESSQKDPLVESHFIKVCDLTQGACFNIGESFRNRRVVATTHTRVLLVPRYWIWKNNKDNIWSRVKQFLEKHIPTTEELFERFVDQKKFLRYGKKLVADIMANKKVTNHNTIHNVPYSIRLKEGTDDYLTQ